MPLFDKIVTYSVSVFHNDILDHDRQIRLKLKSGGTALIGFPAQRPPDWLQFSGSSTTLYLTAADYDDVYHVLQTERPVFFTAINLLGIRAGAVHTELDLNAGETPGEGETDPSLEALIRRAMKADPTLTLPRAVAGTKAKRRSNARAAGQRRPPR
jgi:hypothetical protein